MEKTCKIFAVNFDDDHGEPKRAIVVAAASAAAEQIVETDFPNCQIRNVAGSASAYFLVPRGMG